MLHVREMLIAIIHFMLFSLLLWVFFSFWHFLGCLRLPLVCATVGSFADRAHALDPAKLLAESDCVSVKAKISMEDTHK